MGELRTLLDQAIADQGQLTAVAAFAQAHDLGAIKTQHYRDLIPLSLPKHGQQFAFEVDLDRCSGCKACVAACHSLNGLDEHESWREVGTLISNDWRRPFRQTVTTACHHCVDPGCLNGCPVLAYEKDPVTGIVRHLDDQCIGCQYCVMMCPYEVPKYSEARGIVRKCDMCSQRLVAGEAPACVQACPTAAIRISIVESKSLVVDFREAVTQNSFLPSSPDPAITVPTTRFVSREPLPADLAPSDASTVREQPAHWPLVWMLVLTQLGVGASAAALFSSSRGALMIVASAATVLGLVASVAHLGQPLKAWRSFLGLRRSWLSREIVAFGIFAALVSLATWRVWIHSASSATTLLLSVTTAVGVVAVLCSAFVYRATRRVFWRGAFITFFLTAALLGTAAWTTIAPTAFLLSLLAILAASKLAVEMKTLRHGDDEVVDDVSPRPGEFDRWSLAQTAGLLRGRFALLMRCRLACLITGGLALPLISLINFSPIFAISSFALCFAGEIIERYLFFRAVVPPRMPGGS
jgi:Fe-S-cluster-containing dehydrogenase component/DMSO reductase anchor subunit